MARTLKEGQPVRGEEVVAVRPDGASVPLLPHPTPIFDDTGALTGAVNVLMDLSGAKDMERSSRYLAAIVESSDDAIVAKNLTGSSPAGTAARSGFLAMRPKKLSASRSPFSYRQNA